MTSQTAVKATPKPLRHFKNGGLSVIYAHPHDPKLLVKIFTTNSHQPDPRRGNDANHVMSLAEFRQGLSNSEAHRLQESFSWPVEVYCDRPGIVDGIGIRRAPDDFWFDITLRDFATKGELTEQKFLDFSYVTSDYLDSQLVVRSSVPAPSFEDRIEICRELLLTMRVVWRLGYRYCDYKPYNMAWTLVDRPRVFVIDAETVSVPGVRGAHSKGEWWPLQHLIDTMESDRSLCARMMWRVLAGNVWSVPDIARRDGHTARLDDRTVSAFRRMHESGVTGSDDDVLRCLDQYRSNENIDRAFGWAVDTGFATTVLQYAPERPTASQAAVIDAARRQLGLEQEIEQYPPRLRTMRLRRSKPIAGFSWDLPDDDSIVPLSTGDALVGIAREGNHGDVVDLILGSGLPEEETRVFARSLRYALLEVGIPDLHLNALTAPGRLEWSWPAGRLTAGAVVSIVDESGVVRFEGLADKRRNRPSMTLPFASPGASRLTCTVAYFAETSGGRKVVSPARAQLVVDLVPAPANRVGSRPVASVALRDRPVDLISGRVPVVGRGEEPVQSDRAGMVPESPRSRGPSTTATAAGSGPTKSYGDISDPALSPGEGVFRRASAGFRRLFSRR